MGGYYSARQAKHIKGVRIFIIRLFALLMIHDLAEICLGNYSLRVILPHYIEARRKNEQV